MEFFKIDGEFITITQFLKVQGLIASGGEIQAFLLENRVVLNNEVVFEKRKKIYPNDILEVNNQRFKFL